GFGPRPDEDLAAAADDAALAGPGARARSEKRRSFRQQIKRKSWSTTITVTEIIDGAGVRRYATANSPIVQIDDGAGPPASRRRGAPASSPSSAAAGQRDPYREDPPRAGPPAGVPAVRWRQPFLQRMWLRRQRHEEDGHQQQHPQQQVDGDGAHTMLLISVKRQRKLKMKKHKLRKLRRRTRNLRRRLGRD
ncbi:MAG: AURKAIP1/COX24 domain-containing protein, partial [Terriglobus roseus]|nr:AURKAIP1/COX24 domain-containing protein [Terriglobus roseus]